MTKIIFIVSIFAFFAINGFAQTKKDGKPDMRYNSNKQSSTYSAPKQSPSSYRVQDQFIVDKTTQQVIMELTLVNKILKPIKEVNKTIQNQIITTGFTKQNNYEKNNTIGFNS